MADSSKKYIWSERKKLFFGAPWTFTTYAFDEDSLDIKTGLIIQRYEEIRLYRIRDFTVTRSVIQRIFGLGTIHICSADSTTPEYDIVNIRNAIEVKDKLAKQVDIAKSRVGMSTSEFVGTQVYTHS
jgi:uncharacterized membrane protein YdbT with pleckstrin-like domain